MQVSDPNKAALLQRSLKNKDPTPDLEEAGMAKALDQLENSRVPSQQNSFAFDPPPLVDDNFVEFARTDQADEINSAVHPTDQIFDTVDNTFQ